LTCPLHCAHQSRMAAHLVVPYHLEQRVPLLTTPSNRAMPPPDKPAGPYHSPERGLLRLSTTSPRPRLVLDASKGAVSSTTGEEAPRSAPTPSSRAPATSGGRNSQSPPPLAHNPPRHHHRSRIIKVGGETPTPSSNGQRHNTPRTVFVGDTTSRMGNFGAGPTTSRPQKHYGEISNHTRRQVDAHRPSASSLPRRLPLPLSPSSPSS